MKVVNSHFDPESHRLILVGEDGAVAIRPIELGVGGPDRWRILPGPVAERLAESRPAVPPHPRAAMGEAQAEAPTEARCAHCGLLKAHHNTTRTTPTCGDGREFTPCTPSGSTPSPDAACFRCGRSKADHGPLHLCPGREGAKYHPHPVPVVKKAKKPAQRDEGWEKTPTSGG